MIHRVSFHVRRALSAVLAGAVLLAISALSSPPASAQSCTWGGTSEVPAPAATYLRSQRDSLRAPARVAVDAAGNVYATDPDAGKVVVRDAFGRLIFIKEGLRYPVAIAVAPSGDIYVSELGAGSVSVFDPAWNLLAKLGGGDGEFLIPNDVAIDPDPSQGEVYVSDGGAHLIKVYSLGGSFRRSFGGFGNAVGDLDFPAAVYVSTSGEVFVGDQNNDRVQVFDRSGDFIRCFGRAGTFSFVNRFGRIHGLTGDALGRLYVADAFHGHVKVFDAEGVVLGTIGSFGKGPGELRTPMGLAIDHYNRLHIGSVNSGRVVVYGVDDFSDPEPDTDGDGIPDASDNCIGVPNSDPIDTDGDGFGNACDCDYDQGGICGFTDFLVMLDCFSLAVGPGAAPPGSQAEIDDSTCGESDQDGSGVVGFADFQLFVNGFGDPPGPRGPQ